MRDIISIVTNNGDIELTFSNNKKVITKKLTINEAKNLIEDLEASIYFAKEKQKKKAKCFSFT